MSVDGMLPEFLIRLDRIVSPGQIGLLARMRGPRTSTMGARADAAHYDWGLVASARVSARPTESAAACPRNEENLASGERHGPSASTLSISSVGSFSGSLHRMRPSLVLSPRVEQVKLSTAAPQLARRGDTAGAGSQASLGSALTINRNSVHARRNTHMFEGVLLKFGRYRGSL